VAALAEPMNSVLSNSYSFLTGLAAGFLAAGLFAWFWVLWVIGKVKKGRG